MSETLLDVRNLSTQFFTDDGVVNAGQDVSFSVARRETLGIVGESGSGKSVASLSILRLVSHPGKITNGEILWKDKNLLQYSEAQMRQVRGDEIAMIFQEPMTSLDPLYTVGNHSEEAPRVQPGLRGPPARER